MKKGKIISLIVIIILIGSLGFGVSQIIKNPEKYQQGANVKTIFDASTYSFISKDELIKQLGNPKEIYDDIYTYENMEFTVKNDVVTKFKYTPNEPIKYEFKNDIFYMFGIKPDQKMKKTFDNNLTYKFQSVTNNIWEVEIYGINEKEKTFDMVFISYQQ